MLNLRRISLPLSRMRGLNVRVSCVKLMPNTCVENEAGISDSPEIVSGNGGFLLRNRCYHSGYGSMGFSVGRREFSSEAGAKDTKDEDDELEEGFSELEETPVGDEGEKLLDSDSETELSDDSVSEVSDIEEPHNELELPLSHDEGGISEVKKFSRKRVESELFKAIMDAPGHSIHTALDKWVEDGKELNREEISLAMVNLRKHKMYERALQLSEWLQSKNHLEFVERDYASRLDLIAKLHGLYKAEVYVESIPKSFRGEIIYRTLMANCVTQNNMKKAEEIFNKMKDLEFPLTVFVCNQLLLLYKRNDRKKIADLLLLMEHENVKPSPLTYKILIDVKGQSNDIDGMDQIVDKMKADGIEPDVQTKAVLVGHYISAGLADKAKTLLKEMEGENLKENRWVCRALLPLYANLGMADEVGRVWKVCETHPWPEECLAAIEAWGKLSKIDEAEAVFERMSKKWKLTSKHCSVLLKVYANHKMLMKGKDLIKRMADSGCRIGPLTWDALIKLYVKAGEVEKADSVLQKAVMQTQVKPLFSSYITIQEQYAKRGDIHNTEKIFYRMKQVGYAPRIRQYQILIEAYINAKVPAYGIRDRLKADSIYPNRNLGNMLIQVDGFRKSQVSDLLD
ncbi:pentatricopeptide repeat-containing protein At1g80270, mitochondrial-like isoform X1 [Trifolium pratense]|uniref:pentatricopeptide repeat-containing protein At1g80270, mitochondrial-like isoform X1 n=1 Tax=Trifolium pratense TaxID=57577 RepID=UPI001E692C4A|nr:pentatricopeptide repeat-containing protein At1g80270, mitochondrial-like isoform X1 [Trifolium pratense]